MNTHATLSKIGGIALSRDVSPVERALRIELAAAFRIAHHLGWNGDTLNHMVARIPGSDTFLINPLGVAWDEITASTLITIDYRRNILSHSGVRVAPAGFNFHSGILAECPHINCVIHTHETAGTVIGSLKYDLVALSQGDCILHGEVGYHDFEGLAQAEDEVPRILRDLGTGHTLLMRNHGLLSVGASIPEAFGWMRVLIESCRIQERALATGVPLSPISEELQIHTKAQMIGGRPPPLNDYAWDYWMRVAGRLDPSFAD